LPHAAALGGQLQAILSHTERLNSGGMDNCRETYKLAEACVRLSAFRRHYNTERPHSQLGYLTPLAFKAAWVEAQTKVQDS